MAFRKTLKRTSGAGVLAVVGAIAIAMSMAIGGCQSEPFGLGATGVSATTTLGGVESTLPVSPMTVCAAAESVLQRRGYVIVGRTTSEGKVSLRGRYPQGGLLSREAVVSAQAGSGGSGATFGVFISPLGDSDESKAIADAIVRALGL